MDRAAYLAMKYAEALRRQTAQRTMVDPPAP